jgi:hypothetical protein
VSVEPHTRQEALALVAAITARALRRAAAYDAAQHAHRDRATKRSAPMTSALSTGEVQKSRADATRTV